MGRHNWKSAQVVNSQLVCDPTNQQPGFDLPRQQWSLLNCFLHETGTLRCLQKEMEMATYRHWSVSLWRDPDDVSHCRILSRDKTEWRLISATLCGWRRCSVADQLWLTTRIQEEEEEWHFEIYAYILTHIPATFHAHHGVGWIPLSWNSFGCPVGLVEWDLTHLTNNAKATWFFITMYQSPWLHMHTCKERY